MKKIVAIITVVFIAVNLIGCDALQRKFTRKKKSAKPVPKLYQLKKYDVKPSAGLYSKHYAYWQSWMSELIQDLGQNHKRDVRSVDEALSQLHDMRNILVSEKADKLTKHIERIEDVRDIIVKEALSQFNRNQIMSTLERESRIIGSEFSVAKIKGYIRESFYEASSAGAEADSPTGSTFSASMSRSE